jgi:hypothetical protein
VKIRPEHRKAINQKARETMSFGPFGHVEVRINYCYHRGEPGHEAHRGREYEFYNQAFYDESCEPDLADLTWLRDLKAVEDHPSGLVELDLYVYSRDQRDFKGWLVSEGQLDHNMLAVFQDGRLIEVRGNP